MSRWLRGNRLGPGLGLGLAYLLVVALVVWVSDRQAIAFAFALAPLIAAARGEPRPAAIVGVLAVLLAVPAGSQLDVGERIAELAVVLLSGALSVPMAATRARDVLNLSRFELLNEIAELGTGSVALPDALHGVGEALVPDLADFCIIDVFAERGVERAAVRVAAENGRELEQRIATRVPTVPPAMLEAAAETEVDPELVVSVDERHLRLLAYDEEDLALLHDLGLRSYMKLPIVSRRRRLGALTMAMCGWSGRRYNEEDLHFARVLAGRVALALENAGLSSDLETVERRMETAMAVLDEAVLIHDAEGDLVFANQAAAELFGFDDAGEMIASPEGVGERCRFYDEAGHPVEFLRSQVRRALAGEAPAPELARITYASDRPEAWVRLKVRPVTNPDGPPTLTAAAIEDLTEIMREEFAQTLLGRTGELLSLSNEYELMLSRLASIAIPELADRCEVLLERGDELGLRAAAGSARPGAIMVAPLLIGSTRIGRLTFVNEAGRKPFDEFDQTLANRIAERAAVALENARLASSRAEIAEDLQQGLMPPPPPEVPGWSINTVFVAAGDQNRIGGDFYEIFPIVGGWMVAIGDVTGRGAHAASVSAQARFTLRTAGTLSADPAVTLETLNRTLLARRDGAMCTVAVALIPERGRVITTAVAGHPPPLLVRGGQVEEFGATGPILGAFRRPRWSLREQALEEGDSVVLHTDGVTEAAGPEGRFGEQRLRSFLARDSGEGSSLERLERRLKEFAGGRLEDDVAAIELNLSAAAIQSTSLPR